MDFLVDDFVAFWSELVSLLLHIWVVWVYLELMNHHLWVNPSHVCMLQSVISSLVDQGELEPHQAP